jgi:Ca-activated chloride channel family protein
VSRHAVLLLALPFLLCGASWIDPHAKAREAARLYSSGDFSASTTKYNEALVEDPDSTLLHYNLGASAYKEDKFEDSINAYAQTPSADIADVAYNIGNAKYQLGAAAEASEPEKALGLYAEAIAAYRRSMGADPTDEDAKFNHELVTRKLAELQKKLEEQKQEKEQSQEENQNQDQDQDQQQKQEQEQQSDQPQDEQQAQQDNQETQEQPKPEPSEAKEGEPEQQAPSAAEQQASGTPEPAGEMTEQEAKALLDAARDHEARPEDIMRLMQPAGVLEPSEDW